jgi:uncharacterized membrane protein YkoI
VFGSFASPRMFVALALAAVVGSGIGLVATGLGSPSGAATPPAHHSLTAAASTPAAAPGTSPAASPVSNPLTADQAKEVALHVSPGTVVGVEQDNEATDPTEAKDPTEAGGLQFDVTVGHPDGTATDVVVDATTGHVVSTELDDNRTGS